ncbi:TlpA family protein disulfide reductase [Mucilaginibacter aquatilis]|uniref:Redoxin domain-containing protein n=1 Tax=Mucilaginibacter aquatilis TaxID=1517760 RepID=A0A6I4I8B8_9SPHI|nr:TlpA disulfide reductase family protein [Mucilaginibacter aquatilis]MVN91485.1 redoxin domain-containing protein [Mucilaginibacter aquatilis]
MKKTILTSVLAALCLYLPARAQTAGPLAYLHPGDQMPELRLQNLLNTKAKTIDLATLKGKIVILDLWNTWCSACIEGFTTLDSLQRAYPDQLEVILVNPSAQDSRKAIQAVIDRTKAWSKNGFKLPIVMADTTVKQYFKFRSVPHTIWIGRDGKILAITGKEEVTAQNIAKVIAGERIHVKEKTD